MKRVGLVAAMFLTFVDFAVGQGASPSTDVLGAHLIYGRGCTACHSPHSGAAGNGAARSNDPSAGVTMLWGQDASGLYGKTIITGGGKFVEVLPSSMSATTPDVAGMLTCLSCHDGNTAQAAMMRNRVYEALPSTYGNNNTIPTLLGTTETGGSYLNEHPVGLNATVNCGGAGNWDCTQSNGIIEMRGMESSRFVSNYGFFVKLGTYSNKAVVVCTTCHDPHMMSVVKVTKGSNSGLPSGTYATMFFLRGPYNPNSANSRSNQAAQFCRQCHADKSNEMNGGTAGTTM